MVEDFYALKADCSIVFFSRSNYGIRYGCTHAESLLDLTEKMPSSQESITATTFLPNAVDSKLQKNSLCPFGKVGRMVSALSAEELIWMRGEIIPFLAKWRVMQSWYTVLRFRTVYE